MTEKTVQYWYDLSSPYAYLANEEVSLVAKRHGAIVSWCPFFLGGLFKALRGDIVPFNSGSANKQTILRRDMQRWAQSRGIDFNWPTIFPMMTIRPMRVLVQLHGEAHAALARDLFKQYWVLDQNIGDATVLRGILAAHGLDAEALMAAAETPEVKQKLVDATDLALQKGLCGAPTFIVDDLLFWGQDRLDFVGRALDGWKPHGG